MKKRCAWMLAVVLLVTLLVPGMAAFATEETGETETAESADETEEAPAEEEQAAAEAQRRNVLARRAR